MDPVTKNDAAQALRRAGVKDGDVLFVHSALRPFGYVEGGAATIAEALVEAAGENGTVAAPAFCFSHEVPEIPVIDPANDPSEMGAISEALRLMPGADRFGPYRKKSS